MTFHGWGTQDYPAFSYAVLHFDGDDIVITSDHDNPEEIYFSHDLAEKSEDGAQIWHVDHLFRSFTVPDHESYPWVHFAYYPPKKKVEGIYQFSSWKHQQRAMELIEILLSCYGGNAIAALRGEHTKGKVIIGEGLKKKLERGELIK